MTKSENVDEKHNLKPDFCSVWPGFSEVGIDILMCEKLFR